MRRILGAALLLIFTGALCAQTVEGFEGPAYSWVASGAAVLGEDYSQSATHSVYLHGIQAAYVTTGTGYDAFLSQTAPSISFYLYKTENNNSGNVHVDYWNGTAWVEIYQQSVSHNQGTWGQYTVPTTYAPAAGYYPVRIYITAGNQKDRYYIDDISFTPNPTLPVELSSFTVVQSASNHALLIWVTQSETNVAGFNIYRGSSKDLSSAQMLPSFIGATNTSQQQTYIYNDDEIWVNGLYYYWLESRDLSGANTFYGPVSILIDLDGPDAPPVVLTTGIDSVFPNPFNPSTVIQYYLEEPGSVSLSVLNLRGQCVRTLLSGHGEPGTHHLVWDGRDHDGRMLASGVYTIILQAQSRTYSYKVLLQK